MYMTIITASTFIWQNYSVSSLSFTDVRVFVFEVCIFNVSQESKMSFFKKRSFWIFIWRFSICAAFQRCHKKGKKRENLQQDAPLKSEVPEGNLGFNILQNWVVIMTSEHESDVIIRWVLISCIMFIILQIQRRSKVKCNRNFSGYFWQQNHTHTLSLRIPLLLALHHTIVSEPEPFPVKKSQKLAAGDGLLSSCGVCLTQMLLSVDPLRLVQLPLPPPPPRVKLSAEPSGPLRSWVSGSCPWSLEVEDEEGWARLSRLWWEWNWRMWRMDLPGGTSPAGKQETVQTCTFLALVLLSKPLNPLRKQILFFLSFFGKW